MKSPALLRVVKNLASSGENKSERDLEKKRLEYEFKEQDQILNKLVEESHVRERERHGRGEGWWREGRTKGGWKEGGGVDGR